MRVLTQIAMISVIILSSKLCKTTTASPQRANVVQMNSGYDNGPSKVQEKLAYPDVAALHQEIDDENDPDAAQLRPVPRSRFINPKWRSQQHLRESPPLHLHPIQQVHEDHSIKSETDGHSIMDQNEKAIPRLDGNKDPISDEVSEPGDVPETHVQSLSEDEQSTQGNSPSDAQYYSEKGLDSGTSVQNEPVRKVELRDGAENQIANWGKQNVTKSSKIDEEEAKLRTQTNNLVKWLRNRLRKRLEEVASLEHEMQTEEIILQNLNESIANTTTQRENEIRLKLENLKRLKNFEHTASEPNEKIQEVTADKDKLAEQLAQITRTYESLAQVYKDLNVKLSSAGLSHWLETRGKEYMPETAVGVLSKSVDVLSPVTESIEKAYEMDNHLVEEVENVVPVLAKKSIISKVIEDLTMLIPLLPMFVIWYRLVQIFDSLSILHIVFYTSAAIVGELLIVVLMSVYLGHEALRVCQSTNELFLSGGLLLNFVVVLGLLCAQTLICILRPCQPELVQLMLTAVVVQHFWRHVFVPVMVGHPVTTTVVANVGYVFVLGFICHQKKEILDWQTPYDAQIAKAWTAATHWTRETAQAMGNVFHESGSTAVQKHEDNKSIVSSSLTDDSESEMSTVSSVSQPMTEKMGSPPPARNFPLSLLGFSRNDNCVGQSLGQDSRAEVVEPHTRYARWTGVTAWPTRASVRGHQVNWGNNEPTQGRISMTRSRRFVGTIRYNSNKNGMTSGLR